MSNFSANLEGPQSLQEDLFSVNVAPIHRFSYPQMGRLHLRNRYIGNKDTSPSQQLAQKTCSRFSLVMLAATGCGTKVKLTQNSYTASLRGNLITRINIQNMLL